MSDSQEIEISKIKIGNDRRPLDMDWVEVQAESIAEEDLINPITIRPIEDGYKLITGGHRLAAFVLLERKTIPARIRPYEDGKDANFYRLEEISENVIRHELTALDRARSLFELDKIYKNLHPELKKGGDKQTAEARQNQSAILAVRSELMGKVGLSERSFQRAIAIWKGLSVASRARIYGTWLAKHQAGLMAIADQSHANQKKLLDILFPKSGEPKALNMPDALQILEHGRLMDNREIRFDNVVKATKSLKPKELERVFEFHELAIMAWLKGRS